MIQPKDKEAIGERGVSESKLQKAKLEAKATEVRRRARPRNTVESCPWQIVGVGEIVMVGRKTWSLGSRPAGGGRRGMEGDGLRRVWSLPMSVSQHQIVSGPRPVT